MEYHTYNPYVEDHHIFFGNSRRKVSEALGLKVWLCPEHHRGRYGVHGRDGHYLDLYLKRLAQETYESLGHSRTDFVSKVGKNYL